MKFCGLVIWLCRVLVSCFRWFCCRYGLIGCFLWEILWMIWCCWLCVFFWLLGCWRLLCLFMCRVVICCCVVLICSLMLCCWWFLCVICSVNLSVILMYVRMLLFSMLIMLSGNSNSGLFGLRVMLMFICSGFCCLFVW